MANLRDYILRRLLLLIPVLLGVTVITFGLSHIVPGDPARVYCGQKCTPTQIAKLHHTLGLDQPLYDQYISYMNGLIHGDLGFSTSLNEPVSNAIAQFFPATFELTVAAILLVSIFGVITGVISATHRDEILDHFTRFIAIAGVSMPVFWLALMLQFLLGVMLHLFPIYGYYNHSLFSAPPRVTGVMVIDAALAGNWGLEGDALMHLVLPAVTLAYATTGAILRLTRSSMLEVLGEDYIRTARAKGLSERLVVYKHALRNALIPTVTVLGLSFASLLGGAVLTESIFAWPGIGNYAVQAVLVLDYNGIMGTVILFAFIVILANLVVDILYAFLDPRIRLG